MIVSRSLTMHPQSPALTIGGTVLMVSDDLDILGMIFDYKMTFEKHLRSVSRAASQRLGILRKSWRVFHDTLLLERCFRGYVLPVLESVLQCGARLPIHTIHYWTVQSVVPVFLPGLCLSVTMHIVDLWQYFVCCTRSGVTQCTLFVVL